MSLSMMQSLIIRPRNSFKSAQKLIISGQKISTFTSCSSQFQIKNFKQNNNHATSAGSHHITYSYINSNNLTKRTSSTTSSSSVSDEEVSKFSSMAKTWWEPNQNPLISMNPTRMHFIIQSLESNHHLTFEKSHTKENKFQLFKGLKALDVGCGGGLLSESLARLGAQVTAIDPSIEVANSAKEHSKHDSFLKDKIDYKGGISVEDLAAATIHAADSQTNIEEQNAELFDIVCILEVIEHATSPKSLIESATSLLKRPTQNSNGGMLFVSTINRTAKSYAIAILGGEYISGKLPIGTHTWNNFKSPVEVQTLVSEYGLKEVELSGMLLRPPFFDMSWELNKSDVDVNWIGAYCFNDNHDDDNLK